jgi:hypothetical protein
MFTAPDHEVLDETTGFSAPDHELVPEDKTFGGLAQNVISNAGRMINPVNIVRGLADATKTAAFDMPKEATETMAQLAGSAVTGEPVGETPMAQRAADFSNSEMVQKPLDYAYKNPLDTLGLLAAPLGAFRAGAPAVAPSALGKVPPALEIIPSGPRTMPAAAPLESALPKVEPEPLPIRQQNPIRPEILGEAPKAQGPKIEPEEPPKQQTPPKTPPPEPETPPSSESDSGVDPIEQAKEYIGNKYRDFAKQPGMTEKIADYIQEKSQMAAVKQLGGGPGKARQLGSTPQEMNTALRAIGQYAIDHDLVGPTISENQMLARHKQLLDAAGQKLGQLRAEAEAKRGPMDDIDVLQQIRAKFDKKYERGSASGGKSAYQQALQDVEDSDATFDGLAKTATKLNHEANKANQIKQPHTPYTEVANEISRINNERIRSALGPEKAAQYDQALNHFGVNKKIGEFLKYKVGGGLKRMGPGSLTRNLAQDAMDEFGYRAGAKVANKVSSSILKNPDVARSLPSLFKEFINQIEDIGDDNQGQGMYEGGVVQPKQEQMASYLQQRRQTPASGDALYDRVASDPELSKWAPAFQDAAMRGPQAVTSTHFILMQKDPEYNARFTNRFDKQ